MPFFRPPFLKMSVPPLRENWLGYGLAGLFVAVLLGGAVLLERRGLWPADLKPQGRTHPPVRHVPLPRTP